MKPKTKQQWGWIQYGDDFGYGPFDTREEAIKDLHSCSRGGLIAEVGICRFADPLEHFPTCTDFMDILEESAINDFRWYYPDTFNLSYGAEKAYEKMIRAFVKRYVKSSAWVLGDNNEIITSKPAKFITKKVTCRKLLEKDE